MNLSERKTIKELTKEFDGVDFFENCNDEYASVESVLDDMKDLLSGVTHIKTAYYGYDGAFEVKCYVERLETDEEYKARKKHEQKVSEKKEALRLSKQDKALKKLLETFESDEEIMATFKRLSEK